MSDIKPVKVVKRLEPVHTFTKDISDPNAISPAEALRRALAGETAQAVK